MHNFLNILIIKAVCDNTLKLSAEVVGETKNECVSKLTPPSLRDTPKNFSNFQRRSLAHS